MKTHAKKFENLFRILDLLNEHEYTTAAVLAAGAAISDSPGDLCYW